VRTDSAPDCYVFVDSELLEGHTDTVLVLSTNSNGSLLLSGSKDNSAILWLLGDGIHDFAMLYKAESHTSNVSAVCLSRLVVLCKCHMGSSAHTLVDDNRSVGLCKDAQMHVWWGEATSVVPDLRLSACSTIYPLTIPPGTGGR